MKARERAKAREEESHREGRMAKGLPATAAARARIRHGANVMVFAAALNSCVLLVVMGAVATGARAGLTVGCGKIVLPMVLPTPSVQRP